MAEQITWAEVRLGDVLDIRGVRWTVDGASAGRMTLKSQSGVERDRYGALPAGSVTVLQRGPEPEQVEASAVEVLAVLRPEPLCGHWVGDREPRPAGGGHYCGSDRSVRLFINGHRCPDHTPGLVQARARGRKACLGCGQPVPDDDEPGQSCVICRKPTAAKARKR